MGFFERITNNANKTINSESAKNTKRKLIKNGRTGSIVFFVLAVSMLTAGILFLVYNLSVAIGVILLVISGINFILFFVYLIMLLIGLGMAVGGFGAKILDTTYTCPYCQTHLSAKDNKCPSCGKAKGD